MRPPPFHRRARACPSPSHRVREGSRGTGPRAKGQAGVFLLRRSGSGDPELQTGVRFSRRSNDRGGQAPALRFARPPPFHRRARACPSPCIDLVGKRPWQAFSFRADRAFAGDRPPRYGPGRGSPLAPFGIRRSRTTDVRPAPILKILKILFLI